MQFINPPRVRRAATDNSGPILLCGYYGFGNVGDEAILASMLNDIRAADPEWEIVVLSSDPSQTEELHAVSAIHWQALEDIHNAIEASSLVIIGGGGLFHDYWPVGSSEILTPGHQGVSFYSGILIEAFLTGTPTSIWGAGVGPLRTEQGRLLTKGAFSICDFASVRDELSKSNLEQLGVGQEYLDEVQIVADPAFRFAEDLRKAAAKRGNAYRKSTEEYAAVNLRWWDIGTPQAVWEAEVAGALREFSRETGLPLRFVPFHHQQEKDPRSDLAVSERVAELIRSQAKVKIENPRGNPQVALEQIAGARIALCMRYHASLFAFASCVPAVGLRYDPKISSLFENMGRPTSSMAPENWTQIEILNNLIQELESQMPIPDLQLARDTMTLDKLLELSARGLCVAQSSDRVEVLKPILSARLNDHGTWKFVRSLEEEKAALEREIPELRLALERERQEHSMTRSLLAELRSTLGFRLLVMFWKLARRLIPVGSKRRSIYLRVRSWLTSGARRIRDGNAPYYLKTGARISAFSAMGESELSEELARLDRQVGAFQAQIGAQSRPVRALFAPTRFTLYEGQRSTQLALEYRSRGYPVVFYYWRWSPEDWEREHQEGILQIPIDVLVSDPERYLLESPQEPGALLVEFPHPASLEIVATANSKGWYTVYEVIDDWESFHSVGQAPWYKVDFEKHLLGACDCVFAVSERLAELSKSRGAREVRLVRNAIRSGIQIVGLRPRRPQGHLNLGYFGHLTEAWFDWDLVKELAVTRPDWRLHLVGYGEPKSLKGLPENVRLLGKRHPSELVGIAEEWDVAIVPFKRGRLSETADPIKVYEYLAMGLPVVAKGITPPLGAESFIRVANRKTDFLQHIEHCRYHTKELRRRGVAYAQENTWRHRVSEIEKLLSGSEFQFAFKRALAAVE